MKIPRHASLVTADRVLGHVERLLKVKPGDRASLEAYSNGREQGYAIRMWSRKRAKFTSIMFAQYRSSDSIVVYVDRDSLENIPSDEAFNDAQFFEDYTLAARAIVVALESALNEADAVQKG